MISYTFPENKNHDVVNQNGDYSFSVTQNGEYLLEVDGQDQLAMNWKIEVKENTQSTIFFYHHSKGEFDLHLDVDVYRDANVNVAFLEFGEQKTNLHVRIHLKEEGANALFHTASLCHAELNYDIETIHEKPNTVGHMENYGLVTNDSKWELVCAGRIVKHARGSETRQTSRVLTLSETKQVRVLPILYIDENDVVASHANSLGQPDFEELYYMESRGLDRQAAIGLITIGYLMPIANLFKDKELKEEISEIITKKVQSWQFAI